MPNKKEAQKWLNEKYQNITGEELDNVKQTGLDALHRSIHAKDYTEDNTSIADEEFFRVNMMKMAGKNIPFNILDQIIEEHYKLNPHRYYSDEI